MEKTNPAGHKTLRKHFFDICDSALDPSKLARHLYTEEIIDSNARKAARLQLTPQADRLEDLLEQGMANGAPGAFRTIVDAVEKHGAHDWLEEKLKGVFVCGRIQPTVNFFSLNFKTNLYTKPLCLILTLHLRTRDDFSVFLCIGYSMACRRVLHTICNHRVGL